MLGELGEPIVAERQQNQKRIKLKTLNDNSNLTRLAEEIVDKCKLIHESKLPQVERLLKELQEGQAKAARQAGGRGAGGRCARARVWRESDARANALRDRSRAHYWSFVEVALRILSMLRR